MTFVVDNCRAKFLLAPASAFVVEAPFKQQICRKLWGMQGRVVQDGDAEGLSSKKLTKGLNSRKKT